MVSVGGLLKFSQILSDTFLKSTLYVYCFELGKEPIITKKYLFIFQAASCYVQNVETLRTTSQYVPHIDKVGLITAFCQVQGISYKFVAV